jgi:hypothetical protein
MSHFSKGRWVQLAGAVLSLSLSATAWGAYSIPDGDFGGEGPLTPEDPNVNSLGGQQLDLTGTGGVEGTIDSYGTFNGAIFSVRENNVDVTQVGTGVFDPFLRLQEKDEEAGYNVDVDKLSYFQFDEKAPSKDPTRENGTWTHSLTVGDLIESESFVDIEVKNEDGTKSTAWYFELMLDVNEANGDKSLITLTDLQLFLAEPETPDNLTASRVESKVSENGQKVTGLHYDTEKNVLCVLSDSQASGGCPDGSSLELVYDMDAGTDVVINNKGDTEELRGNSVQLDYDNFWGSGKGVDMFVYIPTAFFHIDNPTTVEVESDLLKKQVILYSKFGNADCLKNNGGTANNNCDDVYIDGDEEFNLGTLSVSEAGFEEWAIRGTTSKRFAPPEEDNPVPAPAPLLLMGAGLLGAYVTRRRRSVKDLS